jgi:hypothetical protein
MTLPPEWLAPLLSSIAILIAIVGWFTVDQLDRRRARNEHAYYEKAQHYTSIIQSLNRLALIVGVWETVRKTDMKNGKHRKSNFLKLSGAMAMIPSDDAMDQVTERVNAILEPEPESSDPTVAATEELTDDEEAQLALEALHDAVDEVAAFAFAREGHALRDALAGLALLDVPGPIQAGIQSVVAVLSERPAQAGIMQIAELMDLEGLVEMGDFEDWRKRASSAVDEAVRALRADLRSTI